MWRLLLDNALTSLPAAKHALVCKGPNTAEPWLRYADQFVVGGTKEGDPTWPWRDDQQARHLFHLADWHCPISGKQLDSLLLSVNFPKCRWHDLPQKPPLNNSAQPYPTRCRHAPPPQLHPP